MRNDKMRREKRVEKHSEFEKALGEETHQFCESPLKKSL